jgi:hypothetical protein
LQSERLSTLGEGVPTLSVLEVPLALINAPLEFLVSDIDEVNVVGALELSEGLSDDLEALLVAGPGRDLLGNSLSRLPHLLLSEVFLVSPRTHTETIGWYGVEKDLQRLLVVLAVEKIHIVGSVHCLGAFVEPRYAISCS